MTCILFEIGSCSVRIWAANDIDDKRFSVDTEIRASQAVGEMLRERSENSIVNGILLVADMTGLSAKHMARFNIENSKNMSKIHQVWQFRLWWRLRVMIHRLARVCYWNEKVADRHAYMYTCVYTCMHVYMQLSFITPCDKQIQVLKSTILTRIYYMNSIWVASNIDLRFMFQFCEKYNLERSWWK